MSELSHMDLGITRYELAALRAVRDDIAAERIGVSMRATVDEGDGICPGAHVALRLGVRPGRYMAIDRADALVPLYSPGSGQKMLHPWRHPGWWAEPWDILLAIDAFLAGAGAACWDHALAVAVVA